MEDSRDPKPEGETAADAAGSAGSTDSEAEPIGSDWDFTETDFSVPLPDPRPWHQYVIDKIMPVRDVHLFAGPPGAGKTTVILQMLLALQKAEPVFGWRTFPQKLLYVSCDRTSEEQKRVLDRTGTPHDAFPSIVLDDAFPGTATPTIFGLLKWIKLNHPETQFLIIDGFATLVPDGKLNDYGVILKFLRICQELCRKFDLTILGILHSSKQKEGQGYENQREKILGSTAWGGFSNLVMTLEKENNSDPKDPYRVLWINPRNAPEQKIRLQMNSLGRLVTVEEVNDDDLGDLWTAEELAKLPPEIDYERKTLVRMGAEFKPPVSSATVDRLLKRLVAEGRWEKGKRFGTYRRVSEA